jgi:transposase
VRCRCGKVHVATPSAGAGEAGTVTYGLGLQAWVVFLLVMHHVPVERCAQVVEALTGTRPSDGFVHSMIARAAKAVRGANMLIRALVITCGCRNLCQLAGCSSGHWLSGLLGHGMIMGLWG